MHPIFLHYPIDVPAKQIADMPFEAFSDESYYYFIIPTSLSEKNVYELYTITLHYHRQGWTQLLCPLFNIHSQFITTVDNKTYILCYALKNSQTNLGGSMLSRFHLTGFSYPYQPGSISSYGKWQQLWIDKIDQYEAYYRHLLQKRPMTSDSRKIADLFPYIIGLAENAIQYMHIINQETRFNDHDQPTITFGRYHDQINQPFIWSHQLVYDHPVRDIAEKLRPIMKQKDGLQNEHITLFLQEYLNWNPLSVFGWKLLFCRLLFPVHLLEYVDQLRTEALDNNISLENIVQEQINYEENMRTFFSQIGIDKADINHIQLDWLME